MEKVQIPGSSTAISRLGFGCARIFGGGEMRRSSKLLEAALIGGIRHFDTAPTYGSEAVIGSVLADLPDVTVATKIGLPRIESADLASKSFFFYGTLYRRAVRPILARTPGLKSRILRLAAQKTANKHPIVKRRLQRSEVLREVDDSLRRLRRSKIDVYLLHEPEGIEITDELREVFLTLQSDGVIGAYGFAYGTWPSESAVFGTVVQCRFPADAVPITHCGTIRIYHGVVRFGLQTRNGGPRTAESLIAAALGSTCASTVLFSASSTRQIRRVAERALSPS